MKPATSSAVAGLAGKASLVLGVLGLGVGTAAAAGADVPMLTPSVPVMETTSTASDTAPAPVADAGPARVADVAAVVAVDAPEADAADTAVHGAAVSELARTTELEGCAKGQAVAELASGGHHVARDCDEADEPSATAEEPAPVEPADEPTADLATEANHGQVVSEFARTTELQGCAKGQAVAELASGGNHVAKACGDQEVSGTDPQPAAPTAADAPGRSGDAPGGSGDAPGRSGDAPKGGKRGTGRDG